MRAVSVLVGVGLALGGLLAVAPVASAASAASVPDGTLVTPGTPFGVDLASQGVSSVRVNAVAGQRIVLRETTPVSSLVIVNVTSAAGGFPGSTFLSTYNELGVAQVAATYVVTLRNFNSTPVTLPLQIDLATDTTTPLTIGASTTATTTIGQNARYTFAGNAGQKFHLAVTGLNLTGTPPPSVAAYLIEPDGTLVDTTGAQHSDPFSIDVDLDQTGTWTLVLDPGGDAVGSVTFTGSNPADVVVPVTAGKAVNVTYPGGGVDVRLTFKATAGQRVVLGVLASSLTSSGADGQQPHVRARLIGPDGVERYDIGSASGPGFLNQAPGPVDVTGTWSLLLDAVSDATGTQTVKLGLVTDYAGPLTLGKAVSGSTTVPGQRGAFSFTAAAGKKLILQLSNLKLTAGSWGGDPASAGVSGILYGPDGGYQGSYFDNGSTFGELNVTEAGTYKLVLSGVQDTVGSGTLVVRYPSETTAALSLGTSTTATIGVGNTARYTFTGVKDSRLTLAFSKQQVVPDGYPTRVIVYQPDGTLFYQSLVSSADGWFETDALPSAGKWSVVLDPEDNASGSLTFTPRLVADQKATLTPGAKTTAKITTGGQQIRYTFAGVKGRRITIDSTATNWTSPSDPTQSNVADLRLIRPDGSLAGQFYPGLSYGTAGGTLAEFEGNDGVLDTTGTWTLVVDPYRDAVGSQTFTLNLLTDLTGTTKIGTAKKVTISTRGQRAAYTFTWNGADPLPWSVTGSTFDEAQLSLVSPNGGTQSGFFFAGGTSGQSFNSTGESGTWTLLVDPTATSTGSATIKLG